MRKPVDNSNKCLRTHPDVSKGAALFFHDRLPVGHLGKKTDRRADESAPEGSQRFNGEPRMRNRLQVSFWGLRFDADGIVAIAAALLIVLVFALLLAVRF